MYLWKKLPNSIICKFNNAGSVLEMCIVWICDIPWYTVPAGNTLSLMSALYLWATLGCGVFGCHGNLVWHVRGFPGAPSTESVVDYSVGA